MNQSGDYLPNFSPEALIPQRVGPPAPVVRGRDRNQFPLDQRPSMANNIPGGMLQSPPKDDADLQSRVSGWDAFMQQIASDPKLQIAMAVMGSQMMQGGQTFGQSIGNGAMSGIQAYQGMAAREEEKAQKEKDFALRQQQVDDDRAYKTTHNDLTRQSLEDNRLLTGRSLDLQGTQLADTRAYRDRSAKTAEDNAKSLAEYQRRLGEAATAGITTAEERVANARAQARDKFFTGIDADVEKDIAAMDESNFFLRNKQMDMGLRQQWKEALRNTKILGSQYAKEVKGKQKEGMREGKKYKYIEVNVVENGQIVTKEIPIAQIGVEEAPKEAPKAEGATTATPAKAPQAGQKTAAPAEVSQGSTHTRDEINAMSLEKLTRLYNVYKTQNENKFLSPADQRDIPYIAEVIANKQKGVNTTSTKPSTPDATALQPTNTYTRPAQKTIDWLDRFLGIKKEQLPPPPTPKPTAPASQSEISQELSPKEKASIDKMPLRELTRIYNILEKQQIKNQIAPEHAREMPYMAAVIKAKTQQSTDFSGLSTEDKTKINAMSRDELLKLDEYYQNRKAKNILKPDEAYEWNYISWVLDSQNATKYGYGWK